MAPSLYVLCVPLNAIHTLIPRALCTTLARHFDSSTKVGTLDSLMQLSDDLVRIDMLVENMVRKIEKQYTEVAGESPEALKVSR